MKAPELERLFAALGAPAVDVRIVGGAVRNAVMNLPVREIDVATPDPPETVAARLAAAAIKAVPTGLDHGTLTAVLGTESYEVTSLRRDTACDGRHAAVEFTRDWAEDSRRRDFTFNAMSLRLDGTLFDYHGGLADAGAGHVRFVGDPDDRIQEDYLRILRLFRFLAWYGRGDLDPGALAACRAHARELARLSAERVQQETVKIFAAPRPAYVLERMQTCGVLQVILPEAREVSRVAALTRLEGARGIQADWRRRFAACVSAADMEAVATRLRFSNADKTRLAALAAPEPLIAKGMGASALRAALYRHGPGVVLDRLLVAWADDARAGTGGEGAGWGDDLLAVVRAWTPRALPVSGADVLARGVGPGPRVGQILADVEAWWVAMDFAPDRAMALAELERRLLTG